DRGRGDGGGNGRGDQGEGEGGQVGQGEGGDHRPLGAAAADRPVPRRGHPGPQRPQPARLAGRRDGGQHGGPGLEPRQGLGHERRPVAARDRPLHGLGPGAGRDRAAGGGGGAGPRGQGG